MALATSWNVGRVLDRGREAIIDGDEDIALAGERFGLGTHLGTLVALDVAPAVNEDDDRMMSAEPRRVDVECGERVGAGGIVGDVPGDPITPLGRELHGEEREPRAGGLAHAGPPGSG
jgi:hypothetical protein